MKGEIESIKEIKPQLWYVLPILCVGFILLVGILVLSAKSLTPTKRSQSSAKNIFYEEVKAGENSISISPDKLSLKKGETARLTIDLKSKEEIAAVEIHLSFDPNVVNIGKIEPLEFLQNPQILQETIDNKAGKLILILGGLSAVSGEGKLVEISISALAAGQTKLEFSEGTQAGAIGKFTNILSEKTGSDIIVQ